MSLGVWSKGQGLKVWICVMLSLRGFHHPKGCLPKLRTRGFYVWLCWSGWYWLEILSSLDLPRKTVKRSWNSSLTWESSGKEAREISLVYTYEKFPKPEIFYPEPVQLSAHCSWDHSVLKKGFKKVSEDWKKNAPRPISISDIPERASSVGSWRTSHRGFTALWSCLGSNQ